MGRRLRRRSGLSRRDFLRQSSFLAAGGAFLAGCEADTWPGGQPGPGPEPGSAFQHGVASGDPLSDRVILWTRITQEGSGAVPVRARVYADPQRAQLVGEYSGSAAASRDFTVKIDALGLAPATTYYYDFEALGQRSVLGRTRTLPVGSVEHLRIGVASCSSLAHGYFHAYRFLAQRADLDLVLHLGDYIYEYGNDEYGSVRQYEPAHEIISLSDYRTRHAQYKRDPDLMELHRQHPVVAIWDDHETTDNSRRDSANNHNEGEGDWQQRKGWGQQAYDEWMPIRYPEPGNVNRIWRRFAMGDLVDLTLLDTRLYDRDDEIDCGNPSPIPLCPDATLADPERKLIGPEQMTFLLDALSQPTGQWKLIGQQVMMGQLKFTSLPANDETGLQDVFFNADQWDGYPGERKQILDFIEQNAVDDVVVLTGDIHTSWAMDLTQDPDNPLFYNPVTGDGSRAVEFVCTSVTSPGLEELLPVVGPLVETVPELMNVIRASNLHMRYAEGTRRGYQVLDITPEAITGEWWYVSGVTEAEGGAEAFATAYRVQSGSNTVPQLAETEPTPAKENPPPLAP
ncbi:MAG: alkaline phosphatase D family protein [Oceanococcaceae bacterium]